MNNGLVEIGVYKADQARMIIASFDRKADTLYISSCRTGKQLLAFRYNSQVFKIKELDSIFIGQFEHVYVDGELVLSFNYMLNGEDKVFYEDKQNFIHPDGVYVAFEIALAKHLIEVGFIKYE